MCFIYLNVLRYLQAAAWEIFMKFSIHALTVMNANIHTVFHNTHMYMKTLYRFYLLIFAVGVLDRFFVFSKLICNLNK